MQPEYELACENCGGTMKEKDQDEVQPVIRLPHDWLVNLISERAETLAAVLESDPHQFSKRPCATCRVASALLDRPFGCIRKAIMGGGDAT